MIYLYEYLYGSQDGGSWFGGETKPSNIVVDVMGYWLLTSSSDDSVDFSYYVIGHGVISLDSATYSNLYGVRPVINLKI